MTHTLHRTGTPIDQAADYTLMVKQQNLTVEEAAVELTKPCVCGVFKPTREAELVRRLLWSSSPPDGRRTRVSRPVFPLPVAAGFVAPRMLPSRPHHK